MLTKLILILLIISTINGKILRSKTIEPRNGVKIKLNYIVMTKFDGKRLKGPAPIEQTKVQIIARCQAECVRVDECISLNVFPDSGSLLNCHLFDTDHYIGQQLLADETEYQYFVIKVIFKITRQYF